MMSRRRALLIQATKKPAQYTTRIINSLLLHQSTNTSSMTFWYGCYEFEFDAANGIFTMLDPSLYPLSYYQAGIYEALVRSQYFMKNATSGSTMYYFPASCTFATEFDEATGIYSITIVGSIRVFTPIASA